MCLYAFFPGPSYLPHCIAATCSHQCGGQVYPVLLAGNNLKVLDIFSLFEGVFFFPCGAIIQASCDHG
jgi:hypothetical protein